MRQSINYWVITDTHLGHRKMREYCDRPINFDFLILDNLQVIRKQDILIHLGDVALYREARWHDHLLSSIKGRSWLIKGNHDHRSTTWYLDKGWSAVVDRMDLNMYGHHIALSHHPLPDDGSYDLNVHGHHHHNLHRDIPEYYNEKHLLVYIEHHYQPQLLLDIINGRGL